MSNPSPKYHLKKVVLAAIKAGELDSSQCLRAHVLCSDLLAHAKKKGWRSAEISLRLRNAWEQKALKGGRLLPALGWLDVLAARCQEEDSLLYAVIWMETSHDMPSARSFRLLGAYSSILLRRGLDPKRMLRFYIEHLSPGPAHHLRAMVPPDDFNLTALERIPDPDSLGDCVKIIPRNFRRGRDYREFMKMIVGSPAVCGAIKGQTFRPGILRAMLVLYKEGFLPTPPLVEHYLNAT